MSNAKTQAQKSEARRTRHGLQDKSRKSRSDQMRLRVPARYRIRSRKEQEDNRAQNAGR